MPSKTVIENISGIYLTSVLISWAARSMSGEMYIFWEKTLYSVCIVLITHLFMSVCWMNVWILCVILQPTCLLFCSIFMYLFYYFYCCFNYFIMFLQSPSCSSFHVSLWKQELVCIVKISTPRFPFLLLMHRKGWIKRKKKKQWKGGKWQQRCRQQW